MWPFEPKEDWKLVRTVEASITWTDQKDAKDDIVYYLYESNLGNRRIEYKESGYAELYNKAIEHGMYMKCIYPWSKGAAMANTPSYWDIATSEQERYIQELYRRVLKFKKLNETRK